MPRPLHYHRHPRTLRGRRYVDLPQMHMRAADASIRPRCGSDDGGDAGHDAGPSDGTASDGTASTAAADDDGHCSTGLSGWAANPSNCAGRTGNAVPYTCRASAGATVSHSIAVGDCI